MVSLKLQLRTLLVLGRVSNLPTVWSNCLAAWLLGGGVITPYFFLLCGGATLLYSAGMFLNDAFDVEFDRRHRSERPIPSGQISARRVWMLGGLGILFGWLMLLPLGECVVWLALALVVSIVFYDAVHKHTALAPLIMAACRFFLYLVAAAAVANQMGRIVACQGLALAIYVAGLSFLARVESNHALIGRWPVLLLFAPVVTNVVVNANWTLASWLVSAAFVAWVGWSLRGSLGGATRAVGKSIPALLAGIVLVDWATVAGPNAGISLSFAGLFLLALLFQRKIPAS